ncbi:hypothetical protein ACIBM3_33660 [Rhodococcus erythropolis]|uniref:hypothetical protein n=1 Tax=Rhodococcus erythropolis TaxID=1833 RepID=UPI003796D74D
MSKSGFSMWVREQIDARGYASNEEAARALRVYPSVIRQWTSMVRVPSSPEVLRRVAMLFDAPIQEVLIASGYMTEEESLPMDAVAMSLRQLSNTNTYTGQSTNYDATPIDYSQVGSFCKYDALSAQISTAADRRSSSRLRG